MARYYLHLRNFEGEVLEDTEGADFPTLAAAKKEAMFAMRDFVAGAIMQGEEPPFEAIIIADEQGAHLAAVPVTASLPSTVVTLVKAPEKVVAPTRFEEYREFADQCRAKAESTDDIDDKMSWLNLANAWLLMLPITHSPSAELAGWPGASQENSKASH